VRVWYLLLHTDASFSLSEQTVSVPAVKGTLSKLSAREHFQVLREHWYTVSEQSQCQLQKGTKNRAQPGQRGNFRGSVRRRRSTSAVRRRRCRRRPEAYTRPHFSSSMSAFSGIGGAFRGCSGGAQGILGVIRGCQGVLRCVLCQKRLRLS